MVIMKNSVVIGALIAVLIISAAAIGYSQNWFRPGDTPEDEPTPLNLVLEIYGNANMDDAVDEEDVAYVQKIIAGTANSTTYADANKDGVIDNKDIMQINAILNGTASYILLLDGNGAQMNISLPKTRIVVEYLSGAEVIRALKLEDYVVGVDYALDQLKSFYFPENGASIVNVGKMNNPDYELVLSLDPDCLLTFTKDTATKTANLPGVDVIYLGLYYPNVIDPESSDFMQGIIKAGYIFNRIEEATTYANWILNITKSLQAISATIPSNESQTVFITNYASAWTTTVTAYCTNDPLGQACIVAGGANIAGVLSGYSNSSSLKVDLEWVIEADPDYIFLHSVRYTYGGWMNEDPAHGYNVNDTTSIADTLIEWSSHAEIANLTAVQNNHVYIIAGDFRNNAMGGTLGAVYMAKTLYPDIFTALDPEAIHQEFITRFMRLDYDLNEQGVFMYPSITVGGNTVGIPENSTYVPPETTPLNLVLEIYGNANLDDKIDEQDVAYIMQVIAGTANATAYADANKDGVIDNKDITQIRAIAGGTASYILLLDGNGAQMNISLPKTRIVVEYLSGAEVIRALKLEDYVVGVDYALDQLKSFYFPENGASIVNVGKMNNPDYELVLSLDPDCLLTFTKDTATKTANLPGVDVIYLGLYYPNVIDPESSDFMQGIIKAGYIFNRIEEATTYANWILNITETLRDVTSTIQSADAQTVFISNYPYAWSTTIKAYCPVDTLGQVGILAGGSNIASSLPGFANAASLNVDLEWLMQADPDYIFLHTVRYTYSGITYNDPAHGYNVNDTTSIETCLNEWRAHAEFANLTAVQNNHVYIIAGDFRNNAMGGTLGAVYMAKTLYPDIFTALDPEAIHQEFITRFMRLDYDLNEQGVFMYPSITVGGNTVGIPEGTE
jgi:iron complex transport system substrate-binding protein